MAPLLPLLLLLAVMNAPGWAQRFYGGTLTVSPKWGSPNGTYQVELRNRHTTQYCYVNPWVCLYGNCGSTLRSTTGKIAWESYGLNWCLKETSSSLQLTGNLPFAVRFPRYSTSSYGKWVSNPRGHGIPYRMMAHVDLGTRSDTRRPNRPPVSTMLPIVRVTRNCPRTFNLNVFDPDGDRVRCRIPTSSSTYECNLCGPQQDFSLDEGSCSLTYSGSHRYGNRPIELVVEDFPTEPIRLSYSDGSYTNKQPFSAARRRRQAFVTEVPSAGPGTTGTQDQMMDQVQPAPQVQLLDQVQPAPQVQLR
ncbi:uncharacterized protein LOC115403498 [Salarias fasciatus]|uniref:uncharacterized protein LOC115403498 n=1 Tax=Salarias fasciatus TaxID=181472 RepID=UPI001176A801|nr:uncharacterized protein LOC115403498 [Salarias fasciatus]